MRNFILLSVILFSSAAYAQPGKVLSYQRLSFNVGNLKISPDSIGGLGTVSCFLGDLNNDGKKEIFTTQNSSAGLGHILSLNPDGTVFKYVTIGRNKGLPNNATPTWYSFGISCANIGDLNKDGVTDLAIGNSGESGYSGDVIIALLNSNGTIKDFKVIKPGSNGFNASLGNKDKFGSSILSLGDIDKNGTTELVIGAAATNDGNSESGAIWILSIDSAANCTEYKKISHTSGGGDILKLNIPYIRFGFSLTSYKDINGDGIPEFFVGAPFQNDNSGTGRFYGISINANKTLKSFKLIADTTVNFGDTLIPPSKISESIANIGDIDGNGFDDIVVGTSFQGFYTSYYGRGVARVLLMEDNFKIKSNMVWDSLQNGIPAHKYNDLFARNVVGLGDINKDGRLDVLIGVPGDYKDAIGYGAMYVLFLDGKQYPVSVSKNTILTDLVVYPNPVEVGQPFRIQVPASLSGHPLIVSIKTILGQEIYNHQVQTTDNTLTLSQANLSPGLYILSVFCEGQYHYTTLNVD